MSLAAKKDTQQAGSPAPQQSGAIVTRTKPTELLRQVNLEYAEAAYRQGRSLSVQLEMDDPSTDYPGERTDAFQRLMKAANIRTKSAPEWGLAADECEKFGQSPATRILMYEHFARQWRQASFGKPANTRSLYTSVDQALNTINNPYAENLSPRWDKQIAPAIPISSLVAMTTPVDRDTYKAFYLTDNAANQRMVRVAQSADIPKAKLVGGEREIPLYKYGRALEMTYEQMRRMRIDLVAMHIQRLALQAQIDKLSTVIDVIVNGDGNAGTAATNYNLTTLDAAAVAGTLTLKGWLAFKKKFANPYMVDVVLMQEGVSLDLELLSVGNANIPLVVLSGNNQFGTLRRLNMTSDAVAYGWTADAPSLKIVGIDSRLCIEQLTEIGATISEMQRFIQNQTEVLTMTETEGYAVMDANANKTLNINA